ncbi:hypothetical protein, partial [Pseudomonas syringae group genomosp. 7]|uniref:hypothetical protein n=1 Tax=Pseudomonas syringae group genomosp. 7 TaxID=251699 RepID=UPI00376F8351
MENGSGNDVRPACAIRPLAASAACTVSNAVTCTRRLCGAEGSGSNDTGAVRSGGGDFGLRGAG